MGGCQPHLDKTVQSSRPRNLVSAHSGDGLYGLVRGSDGVAEALDLLARRGLRKDSVPITLEKLSPVLAALAVAPLLERQRRGRGRAVATDAPLDVVEDVVRAVAGVNGRVRATRRRRPFPRPT